MTTPPLFHEQLKNKMDTFAHLIYRLTKTFPKEELFGITSQIRRAALSIILNYIEGFARQGKTYNHFLDISYGSLKETKYLLHFSLIEKHLHETMYKEALTLAEEIGAMPWKTMEARRHA